MNIGKIPNKSNLNENNIFEDLLRYEEYYLIKENFGYKFIIGKNSSDIIIKCKNYLITFNNNDLSLLTKLELETIDEAFFFIIKIFEENRVIIKDIDINKTITLLLNIYIHNKPTEIEVLLLYKNNNKDLIINELNNNYNNLKEDINNEFNTLQKDNQSNENKINVKIKMIKIKIDEINKYFNKLYENIKNQLEELKKYLNNKYNIKYLKKEYTNKINYKFKKEPQNLKYKLDISQNNTKAGWNDIFEIFVSYKDNNEYLISPNKNNFNLDIFALLNNKIIKSLKGHKKNIRTIRYFINKNSYNYNEYLISGDDNKIVIIWDITNNYNINYQIDTKYEDVIYSCLLIFPHNINDNYIITSTFNKSENYDKSSSKIYSLNNGKFIKYINNTNNNNIFYILSWYNKKNNKYYIIQFSFEKILINNLLEDESYFELKQEPENNHLSGFIYEKENNDYLCSSSYNGYINIWDLYNKIIFKVINLNKCVLAHIIEWNNKYIIVADYNNKSIKIIDLEENKIICDINGQHTDEVITIKKIYHPIYGESLLSAGRDNTIKLWTF